MSEGYIQSLPIPDFDEYFAFADGRIYSSKSKKFLKQSMHTTGRYQVTLVKPDGKMTTRKVHTLIAEAFFGLKPKGMVVCHNDFNPLNNAVENLRYDTQKNNIAEAVNHYSSVQKSKTACPRGHAYDDENTYWYQGRRQCKTCRKARNNGTSV
jgi:hypothetical protein